MNWYFILMSYFIAIFIISVHLVGWNMSSVQGRQGASERVDTVPGQISWGCNRICSSSGHRQWRDDDQSTWVKLQNWRRTPVSVSCYPIDQKWNYNVFGMLVTLDFIRDLEEADLTSSFFYFFLFRADFHEQKANALENCSATISQITSTCAFQ